MASVPLNLIDANESILTGQESAQQTARIRGVNQ